MQSVIVSRFLWKKIDVVIASDMRFRKEAVLTPAALSESLLNKKRLGREQWCQKMFVPFLCLTDMVLTLRETSLISI